MVRKARKQVTKEIYHMVINMQVSKKYTIKQISNTVNLCTRAVGKIIKKYEDGVAFVSSGEKLKATCLNKRRVFDPIEQLLYNSILIDNSITQNELKTLIHDVNGVIISQPSISRKIKKIGMSRKRLSLIPIERNDIEKINARIIYAAEISRIGNKNLVFLDETGFNQHTKRRYGYSPLNIKAFVDVPANKSVNKSLICAIDYNGIIGYKYRTGSYNGTEFINFISVLAPYFASHPNSILVMDNARIHKTHEVLRVLSSLNIPFRFIEPYSPELNPIEEFFSMFKSRYCAVRRANPTLTIEQCLDLVASSDNDYSLQCHGFYENMRR